MIKSFTLRTQRTEDDPPPLARDRPLLTNYPGTKTGPILTGLQTRLETTFLGRYQNLLAASSKQKRHHVTLQNVKDDFSVLSETVDKYLAITASERIAWGTIIMFVREPPLKMKPTFKEVAGGPLYARMAGDIDRAEDQLTRQNLEEPGLGPSFVDVAKVAEHLAWRRVVRLAVAVCLVRAHSYQRLWKEVDGDAGWWLHEQIGPFADRLLASNTFGRLTASPKTFLSAEHLTDSIDKIMELKMVKVGAVTWQAGCTAPALQGIPAVAAGRCVVSDLGKKYPATFPSMPRPLFQFSAAAAQAAFPSNMFARQKAADRVAWLSTIWAFARIQMIAKKTITGKDEFQFTVTAGNLEHGGKHPPHVDHHDGSMFDMVPTNLPHVQESEGPARFQLVFSEAEESDEDVMINGEGNLESDDEGEVGDAAPAPPRPPRPTDWEFPPVSRRAEYEAVAIKFTQCVCLSFPNFLIYASRRLTVTAKSQLLDRIDQLTADPAFSARKDELTAIRPLVDVVNPTPWERLSPKDAHELRAGHNDHWHVNYKPDWLGNEAPYISQDPAGAKIRDKILAGMVTSGVWRSLLSS